MVDILSISSLSLLQGVQKELTVKLLKVNSFRIFHLVLIKTLQFLIN